MIKDDYPNIFTLKFNREFLTLAKQIHLNMYIKDFFLRLKSSKIKQTLKNHFSSSTIIYPMSMNFDQTFADDLHLDIFTPIESILPTLSVNKHSTYKIHEQLFLKQIVKSKLTTKNINENVSNSIEHMLSLV